MYTTPDLFSTPSLFATPRRLDGTPGKRTTRHDIGYTDRIYARLTMAGHTVAEFTRDRITNLSALLAILRAMTPACRGLARLTVRNMTRGWTLNRPLMLYPDPSCASPGTIHHSLM
ncbi:MAG: hypothetical protein J6L73_01640 [Muribaculaceae bacterium]|nr:hypothetical protein [Muribaculaceae bacterium]